MLVSGSAWKQVVQDMAVKIKNRFLTTIKITSKRCSANSVVDSRMIRNVNQRK